MAWQSFYSCIPLKNQIWVLSEFHLCLNETFALLGCHAALIGRWLLTFPDNLSGPSSNVKGQDCLTHEDETKRLSKNICNHLPINVAKHPRRVKISNQISLCNSNQHHQQHFDQHHTSHAQKYNGSEFLNSHI